jgi:hypothetical protein
VGVQLANVKKQCKKPWHRFKRDPTPERKQLWANCKHARDKGMFESFQFGVMLKKWPSPCRRDLSAKQITRKTNEIPPAIESTGNMRQAW